jgi:hypothetical protein
MLAVRGTERYELALTLRHPAALLPAISAV